MNSQLQGDRRKRRRFDPASHQDSAMISFESLVEQIGLEEFIDRYWARRHVSIHSSVQFKKPRFTRRCRISNLVIFESGRQSTCYSSDSCCALPRKESGFGDLTQSL